MEQMIALATRNQQKAKDVIRRTDLINIWKSIGAEVRLVGSLRTGLLMKHLDIDFHIYSSPLHLPDSFRAMAQLAENRSIKKIECINLLHTEEACVEWHAWYQKNICVFFALLYFRFINPSSVFGEIGKMKERVCSNVRSWPSFGKGNGLKKQKD